jgi:predicted CoA-substrate-specific enzyme activase
VDIGSTASKAVIMMDGRIAALVTGPSTTNPSRTAREIFSRALADAGVSEGAVAFTVGTGYGRTQVPFASRNISEITCHGRGAHYLLPSARTVIDIGGQDTKVISIDDRGNLMDFVMNDKCAAGTGRFLEAMSRSMEVPLKDFEMLYAREGEPCVITNMCSVFAESEVINLINDGVAMQRIVKGLLLSLANRVSALAGRLGVADTVVLTGGVAKSGGVRDAVSRKLGAVLGRFDGFDPQLVGALGAALVAADFAAGRGPG